MGALVDELVDRSQLPPRIADAVASLGEVLSSRVLAGALRHAGMPVALLDSRRLIVTDEVFTSARPLEAPTRENLNAEVAPELRRGHVVVMPGYIAADEHGRTTTLGKEGSDLTACLVGALMGAEEVEIWKDVPGVLSADPRLLPGGHVIPSLLHAEARALAAGGAKVLHAGAMDPVERSAIPVHVRGTADPRRPGTRVTSTSSRAAGIVGIACRDEEAPSSFEQLYRERPDEPPRTRLTLVSRDLLDDVALHERAAALARSLEAVVLESATPSCALEVVVEGARVRHVLGALHSALVAP
jgi:aspartate kinase